MRRWLHIAAALSASALLGLSILLAPAGDVTVPVAAAADCPSPPLTIAKLERVFRSGQGLACYGGRRLTFKAFVPPPCDECGGVSAAVLAPSWLNGFSAGEIVLSTGPNGNQMVAYLPPALGSCPLGDERQCPLRAYRGRWATFSGHFDGPVAQTCRYVEHPSGPGFTSADAVAECRQKLILLSIGPALAMPATDATGRHRDDRDTPELLILVGMLASAAMLAMPRRRRAPGRP